MAIKTKNLSIVYGKNNTKVEALKNINITIKKGELVAIMGQSGSGKSSLLHVIGAMLTPTSGIVTIMDKEIQSMSRDQLANLRREKIGFIFQNFALIHNLSAIENVMTPLYPLNPVNLKERASKILSQVGLGKRLYHKPEELSGGERQRVAIARAMINNPNIILGDEITGNLDSKTGEEIFDLIKQLNKEGITFVLVTHNLEVAKKCDRIISISDGII